MMWKILLSLAAIFSLSGGVPLPKVEFTAYEHGPQTPEAEAAARKALHGDKSGGDMVFGKNYIQYGNGVRDERFRWPNGVIPFVIDDSLAHIKHLIYQAMEHYHDFTCIRFVPRTTQKDYVKMFYGTGCWATIGREGGEQGLSLGKGCDYFGLAVHEMGHTIGLIHEHQRSDRDNYIYVYKDNALKSEWNNFYAVNAQNEHRYTPYDYDSIMHYGNYAFSKDVGRLMTMKAKNGQQLLEPFQKAGFTNYDVIQIRKLYKCDRDSVFSI